MRRTPHIGWADVPLVVEAAVALTIARLVVCLPFRWYAGVVGSADPSVPETVAMDARCEEVARRVGWAVEALARRAPALGPCLPQALAAKWCLHRRRFRSTLHLGVLRRSDDGRIGAHAWLVCGDLVVTGSGARSSTTSLAAYS